MTYILCFDELTTTTYLDNCRKMDLTKELNKVDRVDLEDMLDSMKNTYDIHIAITDIDKPKTNKELYEFIKKNIPILGYIRT